MKTLLLAIILFMVGCTTTPPPTPDPPPAPEAKPDVITVAMKVEILRTGQAPVLASSPKVSVLYGRPFQVTNQEMTLPNTDKTLTFTLDASVAPPNRLTGTLLIDGQDPVVLQRDLPIGVWSPVTEVPISDGQRLRISAHLTRGAAK